MGSHSYTCHPTQVNSLRFNPAAIEAGTRSTYPGKIEGWVDLSSWLYIEMVYLPARRQSPIQVLTRPGVEQLC